MDLKTQASKIDRQYMKASLFYTLAVSASAFAVFIAYIYFQTVREIWLAFAFGWAAKSAIWAILGVYFEWRTVTQIEKPNGTDSGPAKE